MGIDGKGRILGAARRVIAGQGIEGATMRAIAAEAGLSTGAIYHHFGNKEEILYEVMAENLQEARRISAEAAEGRKVPELREDILRNIRARFDKTEDNRIQFYLAVEALRGDATLGEKFSRTYEAWVDRVEELLGYLYGGRPGPHMRALASLLLGAIDGANLQLLLGTPTAGKEELEKVFGVLLEGGLPAIVEAVSALDESAPKRRRAAKP